MRRPRLGRSGSRRQLCFASRKDGVGVAAGELHPELNPPHLPPPPLQRGLGASEVKECGVGLPPPVFGNGAEQSLRAWAGSGWRRACAPRGTCCWGLCCGPAPEGTPQPQWAHRGPRSHGGLSMDPAASAGSLGIAAVLAQTLIVVIHPHLNTAKSVEFKSTCMHTHTHS